MAKRNLIAIYKRALDKHPWLLSCRSLLLPPSALSVSPSGTNFLSHSLTVSITCSFETRTSASLPARRLLNDPELAGRMHRANHVYYQENVRPERVVLRCLEESFSFHPNRVSN